MIQTTLKETYLKKAKISLKYKRKEKTLSHMQQMIKTLNDELNCLLYQCEIYDYPQEYIKELIQKQIQVLQGKITNIEIDGKKSYKQHLKKQFDFLMENINRFWSQLPLIEILQEKLQKLNGHKEGI